VSDWLCFQSQDTLRRAKSVRRQRSKERLKQGRHLLEERMIQRASAITVDGRCRHAVEALSCTGTDRNYLPASKNERTNWWLLHSYAVMVSGHAISPESVFSTIRCCVFDAQNLRCAHADRPSRTLNSTHEMAFKVLGWQLRLTTD